jgi:hypothetical protein
MRSEEMETKVLLEMLCNIIMDISLRLDKLERKLEIPKEILEEYEKSFDAHSKYWE